MELRRTRGKQGMTCNVKQLGPLGGQPDRIGCVSCGLSREAVLAEEDAPFLCRKNMEAGPAPSARVRLDREAAWVEEFAGSPEPELPMNGGEGDEETEEEEPETEREEEGGRDREERGGHDRAG